MAKRGPKPVPISDEMIQAAEEMAAKGDTNCQIATQLGIARLITFEKNELANAIKRGRAKQLKEVERTAFQIALEDRNPAMIMFILKCRAGWREKQEIDITHGFRPIVIRKRDGSTVELSLTKDQKEIEDGKEGEKEAD